MGVAYNGAIAAYQGAQAGLEYRTLFNKTKDYAKKYGKLLAYAIMLGYPFARHTISLLSFSLGCQVSKSCLRCLDKHGFKNIIQNVYWLGGAAQVKNSRYGFLRVVNGQVTNVISEKDEILKLYIASTTKTPIGRTEIKLGVLDEKEDRGFADPTKLINIDLTE